MLGLHYILPLDFCFACDVPLLSTTWLQMKKYQFIADLGTIKLVSLTNFSLPRAGKYFFAEDVVTFYSYL